MTYRLKTELETLGWTFNEKAAAGHQWTKNDAGKTYEEGCQEWIADATSALVRVEMQKAKEVAALADEFKNGPQKP